MSTLIRRREMMQGEELLPYYPIEKITWTVTGGGRESNAIPVRNGAQIHYDVFYMQIRDSNHVRVQGYTKDYTALPEVVGNSFHIWIFNHTEEQIAINNLTITYL